MLVIQGPMIVVTSLASADQERLFMGGNRPITRPQAHVRHPAPGTRCPLQGGSHHQGHASITMTLVATRTGYPSWGGTPLTAWTKLWVSYCCPTAAKPRWSEQGILLFYGICR